MTQLDVVYRYGVPPREQELRAISSAREVYGIRKVSFDERESTVRVEFDATRMNEETVASILRRAGIDIRERIALV